MRLFQLAIFAITLATAAITTPGCGKGGTQSGAPAQIPAKSLSEAQRIAMQGTASCLNSQGCPENVALLTNATATSAYMCTSFMVGPDMMATNSHCIPEDLKVDGADCSGRIFVFFPENEKKKAERADCAKIIHASKISPSSDQPDYEFFQLAHSLDRKPIGISHAGLPDQAEFTIAKMNPQAANIPIGKLEITHCNATQRTLFAGSFDHDSGKVASFADCRIIHGNSGSPVLGSDGRARAIIHATIETKNLSELTTKMKLANANTPFLPIGLATNLACVRVPNDTDNEQLHMACNSPENAEGTASFFDSINTAIRSEINRKVQDWSLAAADAKAFEWTGGGIAQASPLSESLIKSNEVDPIPSSFATAFPLCMKAPVADGSTIDMEVPVWATRFTLESYYHFSYQTRQNTRTLRIRIEFAINPSAATHPTWIRVTSLEPSAAPTLLYQNIIQVCRK